MCPSVQPHAHFCRRALASAGRRRTCKRHARSVAVRAGTFLSHNIAKESLPYLLAQAPGSAIPATTHGVKSSQRVFIRVPQFISLPVGETRAQNAAVRAGTFLSRNIAKDLSYLFEQGLGITDPGYNAGRLNHRNRCLSPSGNSSLSRWERRARKARQ